MDKDIESLRQILSLEGRDDIADLLKFSSSKIVDSGQFGSYINSMLCTFEIHSPLKENHQLRKLGEEEQKMIFDAAVELYPPRNEAPEISSIAFFIKDEDTEMPSATRVLVPAKDVTPAKVIKTFISYSSRDKRIAGVFKNRLEGLGIGLEVFLAHEDIMGSKEWEDEIVYSLERSEIFVPLITENFYDSEWTNQESGMARITKQLIIPICWKVTPQGFTKRYQAIFVKDEDNFLDVCDQIREIISQHPILGKHIVDAAIANFVDSGSFDETRRQFRNIRQIKHFSPEQIRTLVRGSNGNNQVYAAWNIDELFALVTPYKDVIGATDWKEFERRFGPKPEQESDNS